LKKLFVSGRAKEEKARFEKAGSRMELIYRHGHT